MKYAYNSKAFSRRLQILLFVLSFIFNISAQQNRIQLPTVVSPSPDATAIAKFTDLPISYYNGTASTNIPIYSISLGALTIPINISYHPSGIKVAEDASWVGLGWALSAGGVITRSVRDNDDFSGSGYLHAPPIPLDPFDVTYINRVCDGEDTEPDIFMFNFLGRSGKFILKKGEPFNSPNQVIQQNAGPLKIKCLSDGYKSITWEITDEKGYCYFFNCQETSTTMSGSGGNEYEASSNMTYNSLKDVDVRTAWYLTKVKSPYNREVNFQYDQYANGFAKYYTKSVKTFSETYPIQYKYEGCPVNGPNLPGYSVSVSLTATKSAFLKKILFEHGEVEFVTSPREDITSATQEVIGAELSLTPVKLDQIIVRNHVSEIKKAVFTYDYFNKYVLDKVLYWRLRLDQISLYGAPGSVPQTYSFQYNNIVSLPSKESKNIDYWGYYNSSSNDLRSNAKLIPHTVFSSPSNSSQIFTMNGADRTPSENVKAAILTKITYPTGGSSSFEYEPNTYSILESEEPTVDPNSINYYGVSTYSGSIEGNYHTAIIKVRYATTITVSAVLRCGSFAGPPTGDCTIGQDLYNTSQHFADIVSISNPSVVSWYSFFASYNDRVDQTSNEFSVSQFVVLQPGDYKIRVFKYNDNFTATLNVQMRNGDDGNTPVPNPNSYRDKVTGGLRIARLIQNDSKHNVIIKKFEYKTYRNNQLVSSGKLLAPLRFYSDHVIVLQGTPVGGGPFCNGYSYTRSFTSQSSIPIASSAQGYHVGYDQVTEKFDNGTNNGSTTYSFENIPEIFNSISIPGTPNYSYEHINGKAIQISHKLANGNEIKRQEINNNPQFISSAIGLKVSRGRATNTNGQIFNYFAGYSFYNFTSNFVPIIDTKEVTISGTSTLEYNKHFSYNLNTHFQLTQENIQNSDGSQTVTTYKYPQDVTTLTGDAELARLRLISDNRISEALEVSITKNQAVRTTQTEFKIDPLTNNVVPSIVRMNTGQGFSMQPIINYHSYDEAGNLTSVSKQNDLVTSYLWGYNKVYPVAKVVGASYTTIKSLVNQTILDNLNSTDTEIEAQLQNLRSGLANTKALVNTFQFNPLVGMINQTDENGKTIYYYYDSSGRLNRVKDHEGKILKMIEYKVN